MAQSSIIGNPGTYTFWTGGPIAASGVSTWQIQAQQLLEQMPKFLSWQSGSEVLDRAEHLHSAWIYKRLQNWKETDEQGLVERTMELPPESRKRFFQAPRFFFLLRGTRKPAQQDWLQFEELLRVEEYLCGELELASSNSWSALGDICVSTASGDAGYIQTPTVKGLILDWSSPHLRAMGINPRSGYTESFEDGEILELQIRMEACCDRIELVCPIVMQTIRASIAVVALTKDSARPDFWQSMSARHMIGMIMLRNASNHLIWTQEMIADSLLHEAIHSILYRIELFRLFYDDEESSFSIQVTSPWSGRSLQLHSLVHACFVWFGLWNFWRISARAGFSFPEQLEKSQNGFLRTSSDTLISGPARSHLRPFVVSAIDEMFSAVMASRA